MNESNESKNVLQLLGDWWQTRQAQPRSDKSRSHWLPTPGNILFTLLIAGLLIFTQRTWADPNSPDNVNVPGPSATTINYQGSLAAPDGTPKNGTFGMSFAIYNAATGGSIVWGPENHSAIPVSDGLFSVGLGSQTSGGIPTNVWNGDRYLQISVGGEALTPRELIRSVPIAGMALTVPDGAIGTGQIADGAVTMGKAPTLLASPGNNQRMEKGSVVLHMQPGWQGNVAHTSFGSSFTSSPIVTISIAADDRGNNPINPVLSISATGINWNIWSGHLSGTRAVTIHWIAVGE